MILLFLPNDLTHVRGIITDVSQTPLSHVNLKAKQNNIPNAYIKNASTNKEFLRLVGKPVRFTVSSNEYKIQEVSKQDMEDNLETVSPLSTSVPEMDFGQTKILDLTNVSKDETVAFGAKAGNMGEVRSLLSEKYVINGNAIPFYFMIVL